MPYIIMNQFFLAKPKSWFNISILKHSIIMTFVKYWKLWPPAFSQIAQGTQISNAGYT